MPTFLRFINNTEKFFDKIETFLLTVVVIVMLVFAFLQVFLRTLVNFQIWLNETFAWQLDFSFQPISWGDVFNRSLVLWVGAFGAVLAVRQKQHLSLEVITKFLPHKLKMFSDVIMNVAVLLVTVALTKISWDFFQDQITYESHELLFTGFPQAYITFVFPFGFGLLAFHYIFRIVESVIFIISPELATEQHHNEIISS